MFQHFFFCVCFVECLYFLWFGFAKKKFFFFCVLGFVLYFCLQPSTFVLCVALVCFVLRCVHVCSMGVVCVCVCGLCEYKGHMGCEFFCVVFTKFFWIGFVLGLVFRPSEKKKKIKNS